MLNPGMVRDLIGTVKKEGAAIGLLITLKKPTAGMLADAVHSEPYYSELWDKNYPGIQISMVGELLEGKGFDLPPTESPMKKATRIRTRKDREDGCRSTGMFQVADEIVEYIGKSNVPALWRVREVTKTDNQIAQDILDIGKNWLKYQTSNNEPEPVWFYQLRGLPPEDTLIEIATHVINEAIAVKRLALLSPQNGNLPRPYNNPELKNITPDADGLVNIDAFEFSARNFPGLIHDKTVFEILPSIANSINSMYWTSQELFKLKKN
jgi:hypothetical protein